MTTRWQPPGDWHRITAIDSHAGGEPFRVVTSGFPELEGETILARRRFARRHCDDLRKAVMWEPRGHADMYGCLITPPVSEGADVGVVFMHNEGFSTMCGHGVIALTTVVLETGMVPARGPETTVRLDTPAGPVTAIAEVREGRVGKVRFRNVPAFASALDAEVELPGHGRLRYDLAFGGAFYACVQACDLGVGTAVGDLQELVELGRAIKSAVSEAAVVEHPYEPDLSFLYGVIFIAPAHPAGVHSRNVCVFADGEVDRSPTGTGVSCRLAIHHRRREIATGETIVVESIIGSRFEGRVLETVTFGPHEAVVPEVAGEAHITGHHELLIDPADAVGRGFLLR